jgi:hypothetical protein
MEYSPNGVKVGGTSDTILILGVLAVAGIVLWKSGIFDTLKDTSKVADTALGVVDTAVAGVGQVVTDVLDLPSNAVTLLTDIGSVNSAFYSIIHPITTESIFNDAIKYQGKAMDGLTARTMTMIYSVDKRYTGVNYANWSAMAIVNGAKFSSTGTITSDNTLSKGLSQLEPVAED